jgi:acetyltransferase-like isoleucine patch superfamily enzyme
MAVGATIIAYKKVGDYAMAAASALATKDIPDGEIWAGIPAKKLKDMGRE